MNKLYIGVDLGGTNIAAGIVDADGNILHKKSVRTDLPKPEHVIENDIYTLCMELCKDRGYDLAKDISAIGIGTPGAVDGIRGIVWQNVNFGYTNWQIKTNLEKLFGNVPVYVENDANAAVIAEATAGSAKGKKDVLMLYKVSVFVQRFVSLCNNISVLNIGCHVNNFICNNACLFINLSVRCFDKAVNVNSCVSCNVGNQTDVRAFRSFDRTHSAVVRIVYVTNFKSGTVS